MSLLHYSGFQRPIDCLQSTEVHYRGGKGTDLELPVCVREAHNRILMALGWDTWEKRYAKRHLNLLQHTASSKIFRKKQKKNGVMNELIKRCWSVSSAAFNQMRGLPYVGMWNVRVSVFHEAIGQTKSCDKPMPPDQTNVWVFAVAWTQTSRLRSESCSDASGRGKTDS